MRHSNSTITAFLSSYIFDQDSPPGMNQWNVYWRRLASKLCLMSRLGAVSCWRRISWLNKGSSIGMMENIRCYRPSQGATMSFSWRPDTVHWWQDTNPYPPLQLWVFLPQYLLLEDSILYHDHLCHTVHKAQGITFPWCVQYRRRPFSKPKQWRLGLW